MEFVFNFETDSDKNPLKWVLDRVGHVFNKWNGYEVPAEDIKDKFEKKFPSFERPTEKMKKEIRKKYNEQEAENNQA